MNNKPTSEYLSISQACDLRGFNKEQLQHAIKKYGLNLSIYIDSKINPLSGWFGNGDDYLVKEQKHNSIPLEEIKRIENFSQIKFKNDGCKIISIPNSKDFIIAKDDYSLLISDENNIRTIGLPPPDETQIMNDGYVDLCNNSFLNPRHSVATLFRGDIVDILFVKSKKNGYTHRLSTYYQASLDNIYLHNDEINKIPYFNNESISASNNSQEKERIEIIRTDTTNFYYANKHFEYDKVSLMEIAHSFCVISNKLNDTELYAQHNRLAKIIIKENLPYIEKDIRDFPYFRLPTKWEYWVSRKTASNLINLLLPTTDTNKSESNKQLVIKAKYKQDAISIATIDHVLPEILSDKTQPLDKAHHWKCFEMLVDALKKSGAKNVKLFVESNKDNSSISGTDKHEGTIDTTFKAYNKRLSQLVKAYKEK